MFSIRIPGWLRLILLPLTRFDFRIGCLVLQCPLIVFLLLIPLTVLITALIWPGLVPIGLFQFWGWWGSPLDIAVLFWPMLVIGLLLTLINIPGIRNRADIVLVNARNWLFLWLQAGPMEELVYRWLFFYGTIVCLPILNFATFGLLQWFYSTVLGPIADLLTLHQLHDYLFNSQYGWVVGMAIISTNGGFRDEHAYQGIIGWIWAWFGGMFLFLIMFRHGLFAAMLVHTFYNLCILALIWLVARLHMTPEEAQELVQAKLQAQQEALQAWLAGDFPPGTVVDQAPFRGRFFHEQAPQAAGDAEMVMRHPASSQADSLDTAPKKPTPERDLAPPYSSPDRSPLKRVNPPRIAPIRTPTDRRSGTASQRRRLRGSSRDQQGGTDEKIP